MKKSKKRNRPFTNLPSRLEFCNVLYLNTPLDTMPQLEIGFCPVATTETSMRRLLPALAVSLVTACSPVASPPAVDTTSSPFAQVDVSCKPWAAYRTRIPKEAHLTEVPDPQAFLEQFNAEDPPSDVEAEHVYAARRGDSVVLFFVTGLCLTSNGALPAATFARLLGASL